LLGLTIDYQPDFSGVRQVPEVDKIKNNIVKLYTVEDDDLYHELNRAVSQLKAPIELLGVLRSGNISFLKQTVFKLAPDVVLISVNDLGLDIIKELEQIRLDYSKIGLVFLLGSCNPQDIEQLRQLVLLQSMGGTALFLERPPDIMTLLCSAISAVSRGQFILDPSFAALLFAGKSGTPFLEQFTPRELEILNLLANGYTNFAIAGTLYIDIKTVERHLTNMYSKLKLDNEFTDKHLRVSMAKLYLEAIGDSDGKDRWINRSPVNRI
jgi:DNA-binding NarL/FixJ family response regulator